MSTPQVLVLIVGVYGGVLAAVAPTPRWMERAWAVYVRPFHAVERRIRTRRPGKLH